MTTIALPQLTQGSNEGYTITLSRATDSLLPDFDATTCTAIEFRARRRGAASLLFTKSLSDGVTAVNASTVVVTLATTDMDALAGAQSWVVDYEIYVVEANEWIPNPPARGTIPVVARL